MLLTPKLLKDTQADIISGKLGVSRKEISDDQEPTLSAVVGKRKITLFAKPGRTKRVKLGELGETAEDQRKWVKTMRDRATALRAEHRQKNGKRGKAAPATPADMTVREYLDHYYYKDTAGFRGVRERDNKSQKDMRSCFSMLLDRKMGQLGMADLEEWRQNYGQPVYSPDGHSIVDFGVKDSTRKRNFTVFNAIFTHAVECGHLPKNPFKNSAGKGPKFDSDGEEAGRPLTQEELGRLREVLADCHARDRVFCLLMLSTGARKSELTQIRVEHIDFSSSRIMLRASYTKTRKTRYLTLSERTKEMLRSYIREEKLPNPGPLFRNIAAGPHWNKQMKEFRKPWATICHRALLNNRLHDLRHTFAKEVYLKNRDIVTTSKLLGHTSIKTTQIYLSKMGVEMQESVALLDDVVFG